MRRSDDGSMRGRAARRVAIACVALGLPGCQILPVPPPPPRYFTPSSTAADPATPSTASTTSARSPVAVRLGIVRSPLHLREAMAWRRGDEYGFYEQRRWAELPATYVERTLGRELFASDRPYAGVGDGGPLLSVELRAFEEVLAPVHEARVALAVTMIDARCVRLRETFVAARPLDGNDPGAVARGIGEALDEVVRAVGTAVRRAAAGRGGCRA
jgi:ABC-type uncharacterized transport system auxiliary subunit